MCLCGPGYHLVYLAFVTIFTNRVVIGVQPQSLYVASILTLPALTFVKISILLFYKRVFSIVKFKIAVWTLIILLGAWCIVFIFVSRIVINRRVC